jgi:putative FmdB family regulatory protein
MVLSIIHLAEVEMPQYEYRCLDCRRRVSIYMRYEDYGQQPVRCPHCGSQQLRRLIGRVRLGRSAGSGFDDMSDPSEWSEADMEDPRAMARMMRKLGEETGEPMPDEYEEVVGRLEAGENPEAIEKDMPDLGSDMGMGGEDDFGG